jgi:hypothetical protein
VKPPCGHSSQSMAVRQRYSLNAKTVLAKSTIEQWHGYWRGNVAVEADGGKASEVLLHLVRSVFPDVKTLAELGLEKHRHPFQPVLVLDDPELLEEYGRHGPNSPMWSRPLATWLPEDLEGYLEKHSEPEVSGGAL